MHELSITRSILDTALKYAVEANADRILCINILLGQFADEREESIQFYWEDLARGTLAQAAELHFTRIPAEMKCRDCGHTFQPDEGTSACPACLGCCIYLLSGDDIRLESIDVE